MYIPSPFHWFLVVRCRRHSGALGRCLKHSFLPKGISDILSRKVMPTGSNPALRRAMRFYYLPQRSPPGPLSSPFHLPTSSGLHGPYLSKPSKVFRIVHPSRLGP